MWFHCPLPGGSRCGVGATLPATCRVLLVVALSMWMTVRAACGATTPNSGGLRVEDKERSSPSTTTTGSFDDYAMLPVEPFIGTDATVRGPVSSSLQAQLVESVDTPHTIGATGAFRALLHGRKNPKKYPKCGSCRYVRCTNNRSYCSGHCRQKRKLFFCDTNTQVAFLCLPRDYDDGAYSIEAFAGEPPDALGEYDSAVVTAEAPYIGCAMISGRSTGCPASGTRAILPGRGVVSVSASFCREEYYVPALYRPECSVSPLLPFGVCECWYRVTGPRRRFEFGRRRVRVLRAPCRTTELAFGSGVGDAAGIPSKDDVVVLPGGDITVTQFSDFIDPEQSPRYSYNATASVRAIDVAVSLSIYPAQIGFRSSRSNVLRNGVEILDDYDYDPDPAAETEVFDYVSESVGDGGAAVEGVEGAAARASAQASTNVEVGGGIPEGSERSAATAVVEGGAAESAEGR